MEKRPGRVAGKVAIVTGAGSVGPGWGNGKAAAVLFAREGARVFAVDVNSEAVAETKEIIESEGNVCSTFVADVSSSVGVEEMIQTAVRTFGQIDILHNNVGVGEIAGLDETNEAQWDRLMRLNIKSMFLTCKHAIPHMLARPNQDVGGAAIINIGAVAGIRWTGVPMLAYSVSKGAVMPLTRSIALQFAKSGLRCNCIHPGLMYTPNVVVPLTKKFGDDVERVMELRNSQCPMGHMGTGWDIAYAALFLASDEAKFITGQSLIVDGGQSAQTWAAPVS